MRILLPTATAAGVLIASTAPLQAEAGGPMALGWSDEVAEAFFAEVDGEPALRAAEDVEARWQNLHESDREMVRADCVAALEVGAEVDPAGSATGDVASVPEVEEVDEDIRHEMESQDAAEGTDEALVAAGPQRSVLLEGVPAQTWVELCERVADL